jgi:DNA mismatch endonuclease (patch repair protein)
MADTFSKKVRSEIMKNVKSKGNKSTELKFLKLMKSNKLAGWRRNSNIYGKPDFIFNDSKIAIFLDGCFWHGHNCRILKPSSNTFYWNKKITKNKKHDKKVTGYLHLLGWKVIRIWECRISEQTVVKIKNKYFGNGR